MGERGFALLTQRWQTLQHITASPGKIGQIARAALVLVLFEHEDAHLKVGEKTSLQDQLDQALGALMRTGRYSQVRAAGEAEEESATKKFWLLLGRIALVLSISTGLLQLGQKAYSELEIHPGTPSITRVVELPAPQSPRGEAVVVQIQ